MKAFNCFVIVCGVLVSSDLAFGFSFGVRPLESEDKSDGKVAPAAETNPEALKKVQDRVALLKEALIRDINNQESSETALIQTLRNSTSKQLKIVNGKIIQTEEKVVSLGTKDNATIAIYKLINVRPLKPAAEPEAEKSNSDSNSNQLSEQSSDSSDKSSDEPKVEPEVTNPENTQPAENQSSSASSSSSSSQNDQSSIQQDQPAQNNSLARVPVIEITGPDGVARRIHGIAIKLSPKNDGSEGKNVAFQFFKK